ncbi:MAG: hypothetical protein ACK4WH_08120 [Phycisphaerales bacterium]
MGHVRQLITLVSIGSSVALSALWVRTAFQHDTIAWQRTQDARNVAFAEGTLGAWESTTVLRSIGPNHGSLAYTRSEYLSLADRAPDRLVIPRTGTDESLKLRSVDASRVRKDERVPRRFYHASTDWRFAGFGVYQSTGGAMKHTTIEAPIWFLLLAGSTPAILTFRTLQRKRRRLARGQCVVCGYDLSGRVGLCPECGSGTAPEPCRSTETPPRIG